MARKLSHILSSPSLPWIAVAVLLFLIVFQFFYFSIMATQIRTEIAAQKQELVKLSQTSPPDAADALDASKANQQQQALIKDLNKKFAGYDQSIQSIVAAIQALQRPAVANPAPSPSASN